MKLLLKSTLLGAGILMATTVLTSQSFAQDRFAKVEVTAEHTRGGIYALFGSGGNIGVSIGEDGVFLIDDQYAPLTDKILAAIKKLTDKPVKFVVNTHWHGDHTGGNENLGKMGSVIVAHDNVRVRMNASQLDKVTAGEMKAVAGASLPVITFNDEVSFHLNGKEARAYHISNAHTDGDSIIHFASENVIHMGDTFFNGRFPYIDVGSGGTVDGALAAIQKGLSLSNDDTIIIPGHGPMANKADLRAYGEMIQTVRDRVAKLKVEGKSLEDTVAAKPADKYAEKWNWNFINAERFVGAIYKSLP